MHVRDPLFTALGLTQVDERVLKVIIDEYNLTLDAVAELLGSRSSQRRARLMHAIELRRRALSWLHSEQVRLLAAWRAEAHDEDLQSLLLTVNAIAMGQKATG